MDHEKVNPGAPGGRTIPEELVRDFESWLEASDVAARTIWRYVPDAAHFAAWLGDRPLSATSLRDYRKWLQYEKPNERRGGVGLRPRSLRCAFTALFKFCGYLETEHGWRDVPRRGCIKLPDLDAVQREVPTEAEVAALFAAAAKVGLSARTPGYRDYLRARSQCVLSLLANAGLRFRELLSLRYSDVKQDREPWVLAVREGKGGQSRWLPLNPAARAHVEAWLRVRERWLKRYHRTSDALFPYGSKDQLGANGLYAIFGELKALAGLEDRGFTPHGLRHAFATGLLGRTDLKTLQTLMGHKSMQTTLSTYLHTNPEKMAAAVDALPQAEPPAAPAVPEPAPLRPIPPPENHSGRIKPRRRAAAGGENWRNLL
jgi:integrase/recombinase XerD